MVCFNAGKFLTAQKANFVLNRHYHPMLIAQWQYAVTRKDMAETFSFEDFKEVLFDPNTFRFLNLLLVASDISRFNSI